MDTPPYPQLVTENVKRAVDDAKQTELGLSKATGIPRTTLRARLQGVKPFDVVQLAAIASALGTSVEALTSAERTAS